MYVVPINDYCNVLHCIGKYFENIFEVVGGLKKHTQLRNVLRISPVLIYTVHIKLSTFIYFVDIKTK